MVRKRPDAIRMEGADGVHELLKQLDAHRDVYLDTFRQVHDLLARNIAATAPSTFSPLGSSPGSPLPERRSPRPSISHAESERPNGRKSSAGLATLTTYSESKRTSEDSDRDDEDEDLYVSNPLEPRKHDEESLRKHLQSYKWGSDAARILETVIDRPVRMLQHPLIPQRKGPLDDRSHFSHCQVYDVGPDGAPLLIDCKHVEEEFNSAQAIWYAIKELNQPPKERLAVGRISVLRELSPILFGAVHHTLHKSLDVDELFSCLVASERTSAYMHRAFDDDLRKQKSFVFNFEYFTIIGKDCRPMRWQMADRQEQRGSHHIPVTRCSSVVALVLSGPPIQKIRNPARRANNSHGFAYDPWSSWQVVNLQCYPDWKASMDVHDSTKHYVNGPEAFLVTLLNEFRDSQRRYERIYEEITRLITPPLDFIFNSDIRDKLLFEDKDFTYARRYFWAYQTLGLMTDSIKAMIDAYEDTFTDEVWAGTHKTLWPLLEQHSPRNLYFKKKMAALRLKFEAEMKNLKKLMDENDERRDEIRGLKEDLFTGTSIQESRKSVENTEITIQQGHNIKLLTLVSIFFLPLTFVTSVFGT
ncbi:hypothetical protein LTR85_010987 [Meristemomyces frigidus]|nr:hypothetical protein LTR85_010987 [Meristemomyces frigidus]